MAFIFSTQKSYFITFYTLKVNPPITIVWFLKTMSTYIDIFSTIYYSTQLNTLQ